MKNTTGYWIVSMTFCKKLDIQNVQKNMWKLDFFTSNKDDQIMVQRISNRARKN